nr:retrovirus-related Pol polyprotein from transposon TNT 1-94 [Tanacetum cinerariifolium]
MILEPGDPAREVLVPETFHEQTDDELTEAEIKQMEADDQAIQAILLGIPEDIYVVVDSCETAQEIWLRVQQMMKGSDIGIQEKKAKLFNKWEMFTSTDGESIESYYHCFSKLNDFKRNKHFLEKITGNLKFLNNVQPEWSRHVTIVHQTKELHTTDYTQLYDFLKYNQKENVGNQNGLTVVLRIANQNGNDNVVASWTEGNAYGNSGNQIRCYNCRGLGHLARNCTVRPRRRDAAYLQTQLLIAQKEESDKAPVYDSNGSAEVHLSRNCDDNDIFNMFTQEEQYTELLEPIPEPHQVRHNDSNVISAVSSVEQGGRTIKHHSVTLEETRAYHESLFHNLAAEVKKVNSVNRRMKEFLVTVCFGNDHVAAISGFDDLQWGNILITRVYFIEGLGDNLFSVRQFCDSNLEVTFRRNTCFVRNIEGVDLLKGNLTTNLYTINLLDMASASPICLMDRAMSTKSWLWHQRLSHLNFDTINDLAKNDLVTGLPKFKYHKEHLCPLCEQGKSKRVYHRPKHVPNSKQRLYLLHMDLCGPMRIASINEKRYVLVIVDDYSRYTWVLFLRSKDKAPEEIKTFLKKTTVLLQALVIINRSIIHRRFDKAPYELINGRKPDISFLHVFGDLCYPKNDREDIGKLGAKGDIGFFIGYSANSCELDLLFEAIYDDHIGGQPSATLRTVSAAQAPQVLQTPTATTTIADTAPTPTPTNSSSQATNFPNNLQDVDELKTQQQHVQHQPETLADNVLNAVFDDNTFVNPFATPSTSATQSSSSQYADPSNMHAFYQPYPHEYQWTKDHPLEQVIKEPSRPILTRNQLRSDGDMCMYALTNHVFKGTSDPTLFIRRFDEDFLVMMGETTFFLALQLNQSPCGIFINQPSYVLEILKKYGIETCDPVGTPMEIKDKLDLDQNGSLVDATKYRSMIGALMYLTSSIPNINYGFELIGFSDANYAGCKDTFKSTSGEAQFLGKKLVSWPSKKQDCTALSFVEAEYVKENQENDKIGSKPDKNGKRVEAGKSLK